MQLFVRHAVALALGATLTLLASAAAADQLATVDPLPPGPYAVGCSNVAQDFSRVMPGESAQNYWEGYPANGRDRYITQLLVDPADALVVPVTVPDDRELFVNHATQQVAYALLVCYPTTSDNPYPDYALPTGQVVPHMQQGAQSPIWADGAVRWPVLLFSHGFLGSPISSDYIAALTLLASYGYVLVAPFHGDARFALIQIENLSDFFYAVLHFSTFVEMQAMRPLSLTRGLDYVLAHSQYRDHVDPNRVAGFGASQGSESLLLQAGAKLTITVGLSSKQVVADPRLKAIVGYVPYFGQVILPAFGRNQAGLDGIATPFLGIAGTADTTAPLASTIDGVLQLSGSRDLVALQGVEHHFDYPSAPDTFTWSLTFLAAHTLDDRLARAKIARMTTVRGGGDDHLLIDYTAPAPLSPGEHDVIEYYSPSLRHYFITGEPAEVAMLDAGVIVPGWLRTGYQFKSWSLDAGRGLAACRFFGTPGLAPNSHFYTIDPTECAKVRADPFWQYEGLAFAEDIPSLDECPADRVPVYRLYNNGMGGQASHRFVTSKSEAAATVLGGWLIEGTVFCATP